MSVSGFRRVKTRAELTKSSTVKWDNLKKTEREESKPKHAYKNTVVNKAMIDSSEYRRRIDKISGNTEVNRSIWNKAKEMLTHRSGTKYEDLAFIDSTTGKSLINKGFDQENYAKPSKKMQEMLRKAEPYTIIGVHNHPGSSIPSYADIKTCANRKYKCGVVVGHDGSIFVYSVNFEKFNEPMTVSALAKLETIGYNDSVKTMFREAGINMEVL